MALIKSAGGQDHNTDEIRQELDRRITKLKHEIGGKLAAARVARLKLHMGKAGARQDTERLYGEYRAMVEQLGWLEDAREGLTIVEATPEYFSASMGSIPASRRSDPIEPAQAPQIEQMDEDTPPTNPGDPGNEARDLEMSRDRISTA